MLKRQDDSLSAALYAELPEDARKVPIHGALANVQSRRNFFRGLAKRRETQDLHLSGR